MIKTPFIFGPNRLSRIGDCICSLPLLTYLKKQFPESYITCFIDRSCWQIAPLLFNDSRIDKIQISQEPDKVTKQEIQDWKNYDIVFNPYPNLVQEDYFNYYSVQKANFLISEVLNNNSWHKINPRVYDELNEEEKCPRLTPWFKTKREEKTIALWPFVGYNLNDLTSRKRSPSLLWWMGIIDFLKDQGYKIKQFGHPNSLYIEVCGVQDCRNLSLFEAVKESLGCDFAIGADSGSMHVLGAYGFPQLILYTNWQTNHHNNLTAYLPMNWRGNLNSVYNRNLDSISKEEVWKKIKEIK